MMPKPQFSAPILYILLVLISQILVAQDNNNDHGAEKDYRQKISRHLQVEGGFVNANLSFEKGNNIGLAIRMLFSRDRSGNQIGGYFLQYRPNLSEMGSRFFRDDFSIGFALHRYLLDDVRLNPLIETTVGFGRYVFPSSAGGSTVNDNLVRKNYLDLGIGFGVQMWAGRHFALDGLGRAIFNLGSETGLNQVTIALAGSCLF